MKITVNGIPLPEAAVEFELNRLLRFYSEQMSRDQLEAQLDALRRRAVDQAIGARLLLDRAEAMKLEPDVADIETRIERMEQEAGGAEAFKRALARQKLTIETVREGVRRGRRVDLLVAKITEGVDDPTEREIREHFEAHVEEYRTADRAEAQHILIQPRDDTPEAHRDARAKLAEVRRRVEKGADFSELAAAHSDCPSGKNTGGGLGWFARGSMLPEFDQAVFAMEIGELSEIVQTPVGYHLIRKLGHVEGGPAELPDVSDRIREFLRHVRRGERISEYVAELRAKAEVVIEGDDGADG